MKLMTDNIASFQPNIFQLFPLERTKGNDFDIDLSPSEKPETERFKFKSSLKVLVLWGFNSQPNSPAILSELGGPHFEYPNQAFNVKDDITQDDFDNYADFSEYDLAILPAELTWFDKQKTDLYGSTVAGQLRLRNFAGIIILRSEIPSYIAYHLKNETRKNRTAAKNKERSLDLAVINMGFTYVWDISPEADGGISILTEANIGNIEDYKSAWDTLQNDQMKEIETLIYLKKKPKVFWNAQNVAKEKRKKDETAENIENNSYSHRMSPGRLKDVKYSLLPEGKFSIIRHEYKRLTQGAKEITPFIETAINALADIEYMVKPFKVNDFKKLAAVILDYVKGQDRNLEAARGVFDLYKDELLSFLPYDETDSGSKQKTVEKQAAGWGVLLLEDDETAAGQVKELLYKNNIPIWHTRNAIEAIDLLVKDYAAQLPRPTTNNKDDESFYASNFIRVVLADIRLQNLPPNLSSRWDMIQGYEFVDMLHNTMPNFVTPIILTQQEQRMLRRSSATNPIWFPKSILRGEGNQELFVEKILELGDRMNEYSIPRAALWRDGYPDVNKQSYSVYYKHYRLNAQYHDNEEWVNKVTSLFFLIWENGHKSLKENNIIKRHKVKLKNNIHKEVTDGIKDLVGDMEEETMIKMFRAKLAARRAALTISSYLINKGEDSADYKDLDKLIKSIENIERGAKNEIESAKRKIEKLKIKINDNSDEYLKQICYLIKNKEYVPKNSIDTIEARLKIQKEEKIKSLKLAWKIKKWKKVNDAQEIPDNVVNNLKEAVERDFRSSEFSLIDPILLNKQLGLDTELYYWCKPDNLLIEEQRWLKQLEESDWNVDNYLG